MSVELNNLVASCQQAINNLSTSWEQAVRTHPVDKLLKQHCYKSATGLLQLVDHRQYIYTCGSTLAFDQNFQLFENVFLSVKDHYFGDRKCFWIFSKHSE